MRQVEFTHMTHSLKASSLYKLMGNEYSADEVHNNNVIDNPLHMSYVELVCLINELWQHYLPLLYTWFQCQIHLCCWRTALNELRHTFF